MRLMVQQLDSGGQALRVEAGSGAGLDAGAEPTSPS